VYRFSTRAKKVWVGIELTKIRLQGERSSHHELPNHVVGSLGFEPRLRSLKATMPEGAFYGQTLLANSDCLSAIKIKRILKYVTQTTTDQSDP
jgi:hypothetical protein